MTTKPQSIDIFVHNLGPVIDQNTAQAIYFDYLVLVDTFVIDLRDYVPIPYGDKFVLTTIESTGQLVKSTLTASYGVNCKYGYMGALCDLKCDMTAKPRNAVNNQPSNKNSQQQTQSTQPQPTVICNSFCLIFRASALLPTTKGHRHSGSQYGLPSADFCFRCPAFAFLVDRMYNLPLRLVITRRKKDDRRPHPDYNRVSGTSPQYDRSKNPLLRTGESSTPRNLPSVSSDEWSRGPPPTAIQRGMKAPVAPIADLNETSPSENDLRFAPRREAQDYEVLSVYLYFDSDSQWNAAYNHSLSCQQKEEIINPTNNQILRMSPSSNSENGTPACDAFNKNNESWYRCTGNKTFFSMRPRWWFIAVGNCNSTKGLYLDYSLFMTNSLSFNRWFFHFSFDEFYALPITMMFLALQLIILLAASIFTYLLKERKMFHMTYKIFLHALCFELMSILLLWMHYDKYADDGRGFPMFKSLALLLRQFSTVIFVLLLLLVAKGYTITRAKICALTTFKLIAFTMTLLFLHIVHIAWAIAMFDPAKVTYISESLPAYLLSGLRLIAWCCLSAFITFWFWASPVTLIIANFVLDNWVRAEVMLGVDCSVMAYGFILFLILTCPVSENKNFPYHVRTNQISQVNFPQNVYEVQYTTNTTDNNQTNVTS
uniref:GPR180/TMEM145 transmembrane domain-containing protein n=1 Tax=Ditylenchus dipsaci TaxID=166011 RepID=A0A915EFP4_9BILA